MYAAAHRSARYEAISRSHSGCTNATISAGSRWASSAVIRAATASASSPPVSARACSTSRHTPSVSMARQYHIKIDDGGQAGLALTGDNLLLRRLCSGTLQESQIECREYSTIHNSHVYYQPKHSPAFRTTTDRRVSA